MFAKKLVRLSKYLELKGISGKELQNLLLSERQNNTEKSKLKDRRSKDKEQPRWDSDITSNDDEYPLRAS